MHAFQAAINHSCVQNASKSYAMAIMGTAPWDRSKQAPMRSLFPDICLSHLSPLKLPSNSTVLEEVP